MHLFLWTILFVAGASLASFFCAVLSRRKQKSLRGLKRSHCDQCGKTLKWHELIPVFSYLWNGGKCRSCGKKIPFWYFILEVLGGVLAVGIAALL